MDKKRGLTLVEIIVTLAILSIISLAFLNIFSSSFAQIFSAGRSTEFFFDSMSELETAKNDEEYRGENYNVLTAFSKVKIFENLEIPENASAIKPQEIEVWKIKSKVGPKDKPLSEDDDYLFYYTVGAFQEYHSPFISKAGNYEFNLGDVEVDVGDLLNKKGYTFTGKGVLVIPEKINTNNEEINWNVKDGVAILADIETKNKNIKIKTKGDVFIKNGVNLQCEDIVIDSSGSIYIQPRAEIHVKHSVNLKADEVLINGGRLKINQGNSGKIKITAKNRVDLRGSDSNLTKLILPSNQNNIDISITLPKDKVIFTNIYTEFKSGNDFIPAINTYDSILDGGVKVESEPVKFYPHSNHKPK